MVLIKIIILPFILCTIVCNTLFAQDNKFPKVKLVLDTGFPKIMCNDELYPALAYMSYLGKTKYYKNIGKSGLHIYNIPAYLGDRGINSISGIRPFRKGIWIADNTFDYSPVVEDFEKILQADSLGKVVIRLHLDPPTWWEIKNPGNSSIQPDGSIFRFSLFSKKWRNDSGEVLKKFIRWLSKSEYADRVIGIHVAAGGTEEWFYHYKDEFHDQSEVRLIGFREWLKEKYNTNQSLQKAWNDSLVTLKTARLADISGTNHEDRWRNLQLERNIYDTFCFQSENLVSHIKFFCDIVKEESNGRLLAGVFYGYHNFVTDPRRGHGSLYDVLSIPSVDYISSPNDYNRVMGEDWPPMVAIESIKLHGKLWMAENDTRTVLTTLLKDEAPDVDPGPPYYRDGVWIGPNSLELSESFLWKNLGRMLAYNYGGWWFDMWGGWFDDPDLLNVIQHGQENSMLSDIEGINKLAAEIAIVVDEKLAFRDASYGKLTGQLYGNRYALGKIGSPYDQYLREDLSTILNREYKVLWMLGNLELTLEEKSIIDKLIKSGVSVLITDEMGSVLKKQRDKDISWEGKMKWSAQELKRIFSSSGVHQYIESEDVLYVGNGWLTLHTKNAGLKEVKLPLQADLYDIKNKTHLKSINNAFTVDMKEGETMLFRINSK